MRFCVLGSPEGWYCRDLARAAQGRHDVLGMPFSRVWSECPEGLACPEGSGTGAEGPVEEAPRFAVGDVSLRDFDAVLVRSMPPGSLEQVVFRMDLLDGLQRAGVEVLNPPRALEMSVDKYLATVRLQRAGLPTPPTWVGQGVEEAMEAYQRLGGDVVIKPLFGSEGRGLVRVTDEQLAWRTIKALAQLGAVLYLQKFIPHAGHDIRVLLMGQEHLSIRRFNDEDWRTNISQGGRAERHEATELQLHLARRAAEVLQAPLAGVDLLPARDGRTYVIEVNAVPGWRGLAKAWNQDVAARVLEFVQGRVERRRAANTSGSANPATDVPAPQAWL